MSTFDESPQSHAADARERIRQSMFTGLAITVPLLVTLLVISLVAGFLLGALDPLIGILEQMAGADTPQVLVNLLAVGLVLVTILLVGFAAEQRPGDGHLEARFDRAMGNIPGVGTVYRTFDEMSEMVMDADTESFKEVKLVNFPTKHSYALGFVTSEPSEMIEQPTGNEDMVTLYVPMSPNPVMGGYVIYVPRERCVDVDMSVEEGIKSIMTSGVSVGEEATNQGPEDISSGPADHSVERPTTGSTATDDETDETDERGATET